MILFLGFKSKWGKIKNIKCINSENNNGQKLRNAVILV